MAKQRSQESVCVWGVGKLWELTGKGQAFKTDQQKNKAKNKKQNKNKKGLLTLTPGKPVNLV